MYALIVAHSHCKSITWLRDILGSNSSTAVHNNITRHLFHIRIYYYWQIYQR